MGLMLSIMLRKPWCWLLSPSKHWDRPLPFLVPESLRAIAVYLAGWSALHLQVQDGSQKNKEDTCKKWSFDAHSTDLTNW